MEQIQNHVESLDNVQIRAELLKLGEKVGPVTPSTRKVFASRLVKKLYAAEHPEAAESGVGDTGQDKPSAPAISDQNECTTKVQPEKEQGIVLTEKTEVVNDSQSGKKVSASVYYLVILGDGAASGKENKTAHRVFTEKLEAFAFMKKSTGSRLKLFHSESELKQFLAHPSHSGTGREASLVPNAGKTKVPEEGSSPAPIDAEKSAFKGPKIQDLVQFRKLLESGELETVRHMIWSNPRYLISGADTPVILHEGMRHNALHIAAKSNQPGVVSLVLETIEDPEFTRLLYSASRDTQESRERRITYLVDLYLNSPDKGGGESPLHIACKLGFPAVVQALVMHSATVRGMVNKFGETPEEIICTRCRGNVPPETKETIRELLKGLCLVPLLRSEDNITLPVVGPPCSPDEKVLLRGPTLPTPNSPKDPRLTLSAYAGPMSPSKAQEFHKQWSNPRFLRNTLDDGELAARRADPEKGFERIGRKLARELHVPWTEYWQFLDAFADFSTPDGLQKLETHLCCQQALLAISSAMDSRSLTGSNLDEKSDESCEDDASQENYFSCEEGSMDEDKNDSLTELCAGQANVFSHMGFSSQLVGDCSGPFGRKTASSQLSEGGSGQFGPTRPSTELGVTSPSTQLVGDCSGPLAPTVLSAQLGREHSGSKGANDGCKATEANNLEANLAKDDYVEMPTDAQDVEDVFKDSLGPDDFFDLPAEGNQKYLFGQRLVLSGVSKSSSRDSKPRDSKAALDLTADSTKANAKPSEGHRSRWTYRDTLTSGEEECKRDRASESTDATRSFDTSVSSDVDVGDACVGENEKDGQKGTHTNDPTAVERQQSEKKNNNNDVDKSFNTLMTELSEDLECKLVFSPEGKVVKTHKKHLAPDVGLCLGQKLQNAGRLDSKEGRPALDVLIKSSQDDGSFIGDVLAHFSKPVSDDDEEDSDTSFEDVHGPATKNIYLDVKVVCKNSAVHEFIQRMIRPMVLTVGLLEEGEKDLEKNVHCVSAKLARAKRRKKSQQTACFVYGSRPSKTDLDVMRAMCSNEVDGDAFPTVQSWLRLVSATKQEEGDSWPSPSRLRHQHRLSQLQTQSTPGSPHPVSPLVQSGVVTSTPVTSRGLIRVNRDLSPERISQTTPRTWLFKSP